MKLILLVTVTFICLTGKTWCQQSDVATVWFVDNAPGNFDAFYDPFIRAISTPRLGNRLKIVDSFTEANRKAKTYDLYVLLDGRQSFDENGFTWVVVMGWYDSCGNRVFHNLVSSSWYGDDQTGQRQGEEAAKVINEWINEK